MLLALLACAPPITPITPGPHHWLHDGAITWHQARNWLSISVETPAGSRNLEVSGATLTATQPSPDGLQVLTRTTANGLATFGGLSPGEWVVEIQHPCYLSRRVSGSVSDKAGLSMTVVVQPRPDPPAVAGCVRPDRVVDTERADHGTTLDARQLTLWR